MYFSDDDDDHQFQLLTLQSHTITWATKVYLLHNDSIRSVCDKLSSTRYASTQIRLFYFFFSADFSLGFLNTLENLESIIVVLDLGSESAPVLEIHPKAERTIKRVECLANRAAKLVTLLPSQPFRNIQELSFEGVRFDDEQFKHVGSFKNLRSLKLIRNHSLSGSTFEEVFAELPFLVHLKLRRC